MKAHLLYHGEVCVEQYCQHAGGGGGGGGLACAMVDADERSRAKSPLLLWGCHQRELIVHLAPIGVDSASSYRPAVVAACLFSTVVCVILLGSIRGCLRLFQLN